MNLLEEKKPMTVRNWMLTIFITSLPLVGIVMLFVWAFGSGGDENRKNWAKAYLLYTLIALILVLLVVVGLALSGNLSLPVIG
jgi:heme/copper-type cytochrome/quinol oxidase subunit 2